MMKMYQLVFPLPTSPPLLPLAISFEVFAQDLFSLWIYKFALHKNKKKKIPTKPNQTCYFFPHWYLAGKQKEHKEEKNNHCFFPDDLTHKCSFQCYCCCCVKASYFLRHAKSYFGDKKTGCLLTVLSWGWQWALSWDLPLRLALASKAPSHVVFIQVTELDRAAFVQGFKKLISLLFYFSGSWNRCARATVLIAFLSFVCVCVWFMFACIILFYFILWHSLFQVGGNFLLLRTHKMVGERSPVVSSKWLGRDWFDSSAGSYLGV